MKNVLRKLTSMKGLILTAAFALLIAAASVTTYAMDDGAYTAGRTTSYANPDTGETIDGGTNIALGDSMCESMIDTEVLIEQVGDKRYVTFGLGLMSNISNVAFQAVGEDGTLRDVKYASTGSCERMDDICEHFRVELKPTDKYISPIVFVDPMGRDVQFFIIPDFDNAVPGTGSGMFVSEMLDTAKEEPAEEIKEEPETDEKTDDIEEKDAVEAEAPADESGNNNVVTVVVIIVIILAVITGFVIRKRKR